MPEIIATNLTTNKKTVKAGQAQALRLGQFVLGSDERFEVSEVVRWDQRLKYSLGPS